MFYVDGGGVLLVAASVVDGGDVLLVAAASVDGGDVSLDAAASVDGGGVLLDLSSFFGDGGVLLDLVFVAFDVASVVWEALEFLFFDVNKFLKKLRSPGNGPAVFGGVGGAATGCWPWPAWPDAVVALASWETGSVGVTTGDGTAVLVLAASATTVSSAGGFVFSVVAGCFVSSVFCSPDFSASANLCSADISFNYLFSSC